MASQLEICNLALSWIGGKKIFDLAEDSVEAQLVSTNYPLARDALLNERMWTFATKSLAISPEVATPAFGWRYQFKVPADCIRLFRVLNGNDNEMPWVREGQLIFTNESVIHVTYLQRITDSTLYSAGFVHALAARIAADISVTYTENRTLQADLWQLYEKKLRDAAATEGSQGRNEKFNPRMSTLKQKRYS
jgi:hypothetical protein